MEQRNGRIDRYGQDQTPLIHYLLTVSEDPDIRGALRVLERLIDKEQEAHKNIGDAATILGLYDASQEEELITRGVAARKSPEQIIPDQPAEADWLALLMAAAPAQIDRRAESFSLFADDLAFARQAFTDLAAAATTPLAIEYHPTRPQFTLTAPEEPAPSLRVHPAGGHPA